MQSSRSFLAVIFLISSQLLAGQQPGGPWEKWSNLIGEWIGEGNGQPGQGEGKFVFQTDLNGKILVRKNHTVFPATANSTGMVHDDLLIVYQVDTEAGQEAIYFDNEANTIKYKVKFTGNSAVFISDIVPGTPRFRLSYLEIDSKTINVSFEIASPQTPDEFKMYLTGKAIKVK